MSQLLESYRIGKIQVEISETKNPGKLKVKCNDGTYRSEFTVSRYEYNYYKRHMNQKITQAYREEYENE